MLSFGKRRHKDSAPPGDPYGGRISWLQSQRNNRLLSFVVVVLLIALVWSVVWHETHPITREVVRYVEFQTGGNNFVVVPAAGGTVKNSDLLLSVDVRRYIMSRELISKTDEATRYAVVKQMSSPQVFQRFRDVYGRKDSMLYRDGLKRNVIIKQDSRITEGVHQVEYITEDTIEGQVAPPVRTAWIATMAFEYVDASTSRDDALLNPRGMNITEYTIRKRSGGNE